MAGMVHGLRRAGLYLVAILTTASVAGLLGVWGSEYWVEWQRVKSRDSGERDRMTGLVLKKMRDLSIGDTLPDHIFEDMNRNPVRLDSLVTEKSVITYVSTMCGACSHQIDDIIKLARDSADLKGFIFVSYENPRLLEEDLANRTAGLVILYDHRRVYAKRFGVFTFPFNIIIDGDRRIENLISGGLLPKEIVDIIESNRRRGRESSG